MIDYNLAKKLKEAGLPQEVPAGGQYYQFIAHAGSIPPQQALHTTFIVDPQPMGEYVKCPTLEELIEACGDEFQSLLKCGCDDCKWNCHGKSFPAWDFDKDESQSFNGQTPEEAVANLYLAINKK